MSRDRFPVVVHVLLLRGEGDGVELFLLRRAGTGFMDGWYVPPGGHLQAGESFVQAAARECREETGATPGALRPCCVLSYRSGRHQGVNMVFEGTDLRGQPGLGEPAASDRAAWFPVVRLPERTAPWVAEALDVRARGEWFRELYWE